MNWILIAGIIYLIVLIAVIVRIILDTDNTSKTLAYLLVVVLLPVIGMFIYFSFGVNYRKRKIFSKKLIKDNAFRKEIDDKIVSYTGTNLEDNAAEIKNAKPLVDLLLNDSLSPLTSGNAVKLFTNGEEKFPDVLEDLQSSKHHIHIAYYIYEDDVIGNQIKKILVQKAKDGVQVRFTYDDYGSRSFKKKFVKEFKDAGVEIYPFNKVRITEIAKSDYRDHRKIVIVDGKCAFVGGINVSDKYINGKAASSKLFWRDTHLRIEGYGVHYLQYLFFCDWNFCSGQHMQPGPVYFQGSRQENSNVSVQIAAAGPDSPESVIMYSLLKAIGLATKEILITTPYLIPDESILNGLKMAALSGVCVKILVPKVSDSALVNAAASSYYEYLMEAGVEIYLYEKGFVHAKTMVVDGYISVVGTANMDFRSFDLNFEVNAIVYGEELGKQMVDAFHQDLTSSKKIIYKDWVARPKYKKFLERSARLLSPLL